MTDTKFGAWKPEGAAVAVDYSLVALEEIRLAVTDGFQKFSRGGIEVGGVLYGTYENRVTRILAVRPIACEHAIGPSFQLSTGDKALLREQLERDRDDERLSGFVPVGWYLSHTRGEINLTPVDVELFTDFFPEPWQVCMVLKPGRFGAMKAGFFVREADGSIVTEKSLQEFSLPDRMPGAGGRPLRERGDRRPLPYENLPVPQALTQEAEQPYGAVATGAPSYESPSYENAAYEQYDTSPSPYPPADARSEEHTSELQSH